MCTFHRVPEHVSFISCKACIPPRHPVTAAVLRDMIRGTQYIFINTAMQLSKVICHVCMMTAN